MLQFAIAWQQQQLVKLRVLPYGHLPTRGCQSCFDEDCSEEQVQQQLGTDNVQV
jgi:hypothetical protein